MRTPDGDQVSSAAHSADDEVLRARRWSAEYAIPFWNEIPAETKHSDWTTRLSVEWVRSHGLLPLESDEHLYALVNSPSSLLKLNELALTVGRDLSPVAVTPTAFRRAVDHLYLRESRPPEPEEIAVSSLESEQDLLRAADQAPVTQRVNGMLIDALRKRASDIHLEPFRDRLAMRFRVDGHLYEQPPHAKSMESAIISRLKIMARLDIAERRLPQDGVASVRIGERSLDIRLSTLPVSEGERVVLRLLNRESTLLSMGELGMPSAVWTSVRNAIREPNGIVLVTGPTGSGKTTTLYAALREIDTAHLNVMTIEDPVEYQIEGIGQMQVKPKIGLSFAQGLRHILRQDPDVILVGEIRDAETAEIAVRASLTGHLVFATLHTNDATSAVVRLQDMGIEPYLLSAALRGVLAQRLVRRLCNACVGQSRFELDAAAPSDAIERACAGRELAVPRGCPACMGGYRGRTGLYEWLPVDEEMRELIRARASGREMLDTAQKAGMRSIRQDAIDKVLGRVTTLAEVLRALGTVG